MTYNKLIDITSVNQVRSRTGNLQLIAFAPYCDRDDAGAAWRTFKWVESLSKHVNVTLLTCQSENAESILAQLPDVEVVILQPLDEQTQNSCSRPVYQNYFSSARDWIKRALDQGRHFDIGHQFAPDALQHQSPFMGLGIPYVLGPIRENESKTSSFASGGSSEHGYKTKEKAHMQCIDPMLIRSLAEASLVLGAGARVGDQLASIALNNFFLNSEAGVDVLAPTGIKKPISGQLRLLHIGRAVRANGLRDVIRAMAQLRGLAGITLDSVGSGDEIEFCRQEALRLGVDDRVHFHGEISEIEVENLYSQSDLFVYPSRRDTSGRVILEAMSRGLPVVATPQGAPGSVVDRSCGFKVAADGTEQLVNNLSKVLSAVHKNPFWLIPMRKGARDKVFAEGLWSTKAKLMASSYREILDNSVGAISYQ
jgi:glycosyltransferase involved in cell wall biosynthesis